MTKKIHLQTALQRLRALKRRPWDNVSRRELATILDVGVQLVAQWRRCGRGPAHNPLVVGEGNRVFYAICDVEIWIRDQEGEEITNWLDIVGDWFARDLGIAGLSSKTVDQLFALMKEVEESGRYPSVSAV